MNTLQTFRAALLTGVVLLTPVTGALADHGGSNAAQTSAQSGKNAKAVQRVRLIGHAGKDNAPGVKTTVKYEEKTHKNTLTRSFDVEVRKLTPGATLDVSINGVVYATVTANKFGKAELEFRTKAGADDDAGEDNELPFPDGFPSLKAGDVVHVGDVDVTLNTRK